MVPLGVPARWRATSYSGPAGVARSAIQANWRWLADYAGVAAGAAVKADGYGLGARETTEALIQAGMVATKAAR